MIDHAVVLAAGRGQRLRPLTDRLPKALVEVGGSSLLVRTLRAIVDAGIEAVTVVVGYRAAEVVAHVSEHTSAGVTFVHQAELEGSGHALRLCRPVLGGRPVLVSWADIVTDAMDYRTVVDAMEPDDSAVIGVVEVEDVSGGGAVVFDDDGLVSSIVEKPVGPPPSLWNSAGIMALGPEVWPHLDALSPSVRGELELTEALGAMVVTGERVRAVELRGPWFDVGTPQSLEDARRGWS